MARLGRKKISDEDRRKNGITCRLTDGELKNLLESKPAGIPNGEFLRLAALSRQMPRQISSINIQLWQDLARVGGNLNQISHNLNSGLDIEMETLIETIDELKKQIIEVREALK